MTDAQFVPLPERGLVSLSGADTTRFLQGLVTNDVMEVAEQRTIYAALLTPQGKYLHDFFILRAGGVMYLECDAGRSDDLIRRLTRYRLRARVDIVDARDAFELFAVFGREALQQARQAAEEGRTVAFAGGIAFVDPRNAAFGARVLQPAGLGADSLQAAGFAPSDRTAYDTLRMSLGIAGGNPEIEPEKSFPLEFGLDTLHGVSFTKGCYIGQEVTVRMKTRGLVRKRLVPVRIDGDVPAAGTELLLGDSKAGELRAACGATGLALVRLDALEKALAEKAPFAAGGSRLFPRLPERESR